MIAFDHLNCYVGRVYNAHFIDKQTVALGY